MKDEHGRGLGEKFVDAWLGVGRVLQKARHLHVGQRDVTVPRYDLDVLWDGIGHVLGEPARLRNEVKELRAMMCESESPTGRRHVLHQGLDAPAKLLTLSLNALMKLELQPQFIPLTFDLFDRRLGTAGELDGHRAESALPSSVQPERQKEST